MKKLTALVSVTALVLCLLTGCGTSSGGDIGSKGDTHAENNITILAADFAEYDWIRAVLGDNPSGIKLQRLNETGADMHSYQPAVCDMAQISDCSLLVYSGGESEFWITDAAESSGKSPGTVVSLMEIMAHSPKLSSRYADLTNDHQHEDEHGHDDEDEDEHDHQFDEHMWLSLKSAPVFIEKIAEAVSGLDPENRALYKQNALNYIKKIESLDSKYEKMASLALKKGHKTILVADRFPFAYLTEDYGLDHIAAFPGCSAETEASFAVIISLSEGIDRCGLKAVFVMKKSDTSLAETVIKNSSSEDVRILTLDSMQSVTSREAAEGEDYLSVMEKNLAALSAALID